MVIVVLTLLSLGFLPTQVLYYKWITTDCLEENTSYGLIETVAVVGTNFIELFGHTVLVVSVLLYSYCKRYNKQLMRLDLEEPSENKKLALYNPACYLNMPHIGVAYTFALLMIALTLVITWIGFKKDYESVNECESDSSIAKLIVTHTVFKFIQLLAATFVHSMAILLFSNSTNKWAYMRRHTVDANIGYDIKYPGEKEKERKERVNYRYFYFYNHYHQAGHDTEIERKILKRWFVIQYAVYQLSILIWLVRILNTLVSLHNDRNDVEKDEFRYDIVHSVLHALFNFSAFLVPYIMATWLNDEHDKCYSVLTKHYLTYHVPGNTGKAYTFYQGIRIFSEDLVIRNPLWSRYGSSENSHREIQEAQSEYIKYFNKAMKRSIVKMKEFDFIPSIFAISIPLDNPGYNFAILMTLIAVPFNFVNL